MGAFVAEGEGLGFRGLGFRGLGFRVCQTQRVQSTYMVECRVSILGITIMIWGGIPHNGT